MKKKLLFCTHEQFLPLTGGCTAGNFHIAKKLSDNFEVYVSTPLYVDKKEIEDKYPIKLLPFSPFYMHRGVKSRMLRYLVYGFLSFFHLLKLLFTNKFDVIYVNNAILTFPFIFIKPFLKIPVVLRYTDFLSGFLYEDPKSPKWIVKCLEFYEFNVARLFDKVFVITEIMKDELCLKSKIPISKVVVTFDGVDSQYFDINKIDQGSRAKLRYYLDIPIDAKVVLFHGTIEPHHGTHLIEGIIKNVLIADKNIHFILIGVGLHYSELKTKFKDVVNVHSLDFIDYQQIPNYIFCSDVGIIPYQKCKSMDMVLTLKLLEYLSIGLPVVCFDLKSVKQVFGNTDYVSISYSKDEFVDNIIKMSKFQKSKAAAQNIIENFTWDKVAGRIGSEINTLVKK